MGRPRDCIHDIRLAAYARGSGTSTERDSIERHIDQCPECSEFVVEFALAFSPTDSSGDGVVEPLANTWLARGARIGRYRIIDWIGRGGMGVVYAAHDPELDRTVALKLVANGVDARSSFVQRERLQREARAMAKLSHPNVVNIHDVGTVGGQLFIAMEFVAGPTLRAWASQDGRSWREILEMFLGAAKGLDAAHRAGMVHRDFKPENVLVSDGRARVTDFGLAQPFDDEPNLSACAPSDQLRSDDRTRSISTARLAGTPAFMAPELFEGHPASALSDQFSFCVALYTALFGTAPYPQRPLRARLEAMAADRVGQQMTDGRVPRWLRSLLLRGLSREPNRRFGSMEELVQLAERRLDRGRLGRLTGLVLPTALLTLGLGAYTQSASSEACFAEASKIDAIWDARSREQLHAAFERSDLEYMAALADFATQNLDRHAAELKTIYRETCEAPSISEMDRRHRSACLERSVVEFSAALEVLSGEEQEPRRRVPEVLSALMRPSDCKHASRNAVADPSDADARELSSELTRLGVRVEAAVLEEVEQPMNRILDRARALGRPGLLAQALLQAGRMHWRLGHYHRAESTLIEALGASEAAGYGPGVVEASSRLTFVVGHELSQYEEGTRWGERTRRALAQYEGSLEDYGHLERAFGALAHDQQDYAAAQTHFENALEFMQRAHGPDSLRCVTDMGNLGEALMQQGEFDEARAMMQKSIDLRRRSLGDLHPSVGRAWGALAGLHARMGDSKGAKQAFRESLAILEPALGSSHPEVGVYSGNLGSVLREMGRLAEARDALERSISITAEARGERDLRLLNPVLDLAEVYIALAELDAARAQTKLALAIIGARLGSDHVASADVMGVVATIHEHRGELAEAAELLERAIELQLQKLGPERPDAYMNRLNLGRMQLAMDEPEAALESFERGLEGLIATTGEGSVEVGMARKRKASALEALGRLDEARAELHSGLKNLSSLPPGHDELARGKQALARLDASSDP